MSFLWGYGCSPLESWEMAIVSPLESWEMAIVSPLES